MQTGLFREAANFMTRKAVPVTTAAFLLVGCASPRVWMNPDPMRNYLVDSAQCQAAAAEEVPPDYQSFYNGSFVMNSKFKGRDAWTGRKETYHMQQVVPVINQEDVNAPERSQYFGWCMNKNGWSYQSRSSMPK